MAGRFPPAWLDELRSRADIVQIVSSYVQLKRNGHRYWGLCPFHNEKTASFSVDSNHQLYYCFGCKAGGSVIQFVMEMERLDFQEAVRVLADRVNLPLPQMQEDPDYQRRKSEREKLITLNTLAAQYFHKLLYTPQGKPILSYLKSRGIDDATVRKFGLGAAPASWDALTKHLQDEGYTLDEMRLCGLTVVKENKSFDMFRNRAIFPIIDRNGSVIGFGGRAMGDNQPKYLNTQDTPIFNKRKGVYAANLLKKARNLNRVILVEGYMDVIALTQYGIQGVVATLGTALTPEQARYLKNYAPVIHIAYDGDSAGQNAILRALDVFEEESIAANVLVFPDKLDPDEFIRRDGLEAFLTLEPQSPAAYRMVQKQADFDLSTQAGRTDYAKACALIIKKVTEPVEIENHLTFLSTQTGFTKDVLIAQMGLHQTPITKHIYRDKRRGFEQASLSENARAQKTLLSLLASGKLPQGVVSPDIFTEPLLRALAEGLIAGQSPAELIEMQDTATQADCANIMMTAQDIDHDSALKMAQDCIRKIQLPTLEERIKTITDQMATVKPNEKQVLLDEYLKLMKRMNELKSV